MAYEIKIMGDNNPILLEGEAGMKVKALFEDDNIENNVKVTIGNILTCAKGQIRSIRKVDDSSASMKRNNDVTEDLNKVDFDIYKSWLIKSPVLKAERLELFKQCFKMIHDKLPSEELLTLLKTELVSFFKENPKRTYANGDLYVKYLDKRKKDDKISVFKMPLFRVMERLIATDQARAL